MVKRLKAKSKSGAGRYRPMGIAERYVSLLKKSLLNQLYLENEARIQLLVFFIFGFIPQPSLNDFVQKFSGVRENDFFKTLKKMRKTGLWPQIFDASGQEVLYMRNFVFLAHTMIGQARIDNIHDCLDILTKENIPGDLIEAGVWRGGATVFMRGYLAAHGIRNRKVWLADSFAGLPKANCPQDLDVIDFSSDSFPYLAVSQEEVEELFERYDLLDKKVKFLKGWFKDTLPNAPIKRLALLRLDGDLYESTLDALTHLYNKVSVGGFIIVDDYFALPVCQLAVDEFRANHNVVDPLIRIDGASVFWRKTESPLNRPGFPRHSVAG